MKTEDTVMGPGSGEILGASGALWKSCAIHTAVRMDVFEVLAERPLVPSEIAGRIGADVRGTTLLVHALAALELLCKEPDGCFSLPPNTRSFLLRESPRYLGHMIRHHANLLASWGSLDESVRSGKPVTERSSLQGGDVLESFILGMHANSVGYAGRAVHSIDLAGPQRLLALGGGPGTWAIHFARHNPGLEAVVFDLPGTRPFAERIIVEYEMSDRVSFAAGDFLTDDLPCCFDAVWLSHILHGESADECRLIVRKAAAALNPGGLILIHEFILNDDMASPLFPALFSLNMLTATPGGRSYGLSELRTMLSNAGCRDIRLLPFVGPSESRILAGRV
jgi:hypothetical protein